MRGERLRLTGTALLLASAAVACGGASFSGSSDADGGNGGDSSGGSHGGIGGSSSGGAGGGEGGASSGGVGAGGASNGGGGSSGAGMGGSGGAAGSAGSTSAICPQTVPDSGDPCELSAAMGTFFVRAHCSYGEDPRPECRALALCSQGEWQVTAPDPGVCSTPALPATCPATAPQNEAGCSESGLSCWYGEGTRCVCSDCLGGSGYPICQTIEPPQWWCTAPPAECPSPLPQAGEECDLPPESSCGLDCEQPIRCIDGAWVYDQGMCPICAAPDTPIATPQGERPIAEIKVGDLVFSVQGDAIVAVPVLRAGSTAVRNHRVMRVELDDGTVLHISPGHPTADGRRFSDLVTGSAFDESHVVVSAHPVPYQFERTYDILPASSSGLYFAGGAMVGSTLDPRFSP